MSLRPCVFVYLMSIYARPGLARLAYVTSRVQFQRKGMEEIFKKNTEIIHYCKNIVAREKMF